MTSEQFLSLMEKHKATVTLDLLLDLARALGFNLSVEVVDEVSREEFDG